MSVKCETSLMVRARLLDQIDALAAALPHLSTGQAATQVDELRRVAQEASYPQLADLARGLERALARARSTAFTLPYIEALRAAVGCERADPQVAEAFLASINQRLYG